MLDYKNAKRILDGYIEDTRGIAFSAYTSLTRGETRFGGDVDWKDGKRIRTRVPARDRVKIGRNTWLERVRAVAASRPTPRFLDPFDPRAHNPDLDYPANAIGVRLHDTLIVIHTPHWTELNTGGWRTVTTKQRIDSFSPVQIGTSRGGWTVYLRNDNLECYCVRDGRHERAENNGIVIRGEYAIGLDLHFTGEYDPSRESSNPNGAPIYEYVTCSMCNGTGIRSGFDFESGGHPYFDGIRISPDGTRLLRSQPNRSDVFEPVRTESGFTGMPLFRSY